jgi:hydrogenase/urease accessory protein HupE
MTKQLKACCSSPRAVRYWFTASLVAWGVLSLIGVFWRPLHASSAVACLFAMAIGCLANWSRNRSFHCAITGPLFLVAGTVFLLSDVHLIQAEAAWVWSFVVLGACIAFLLEWRYARRSV